MITKKDKVDEVILTDEYKRAIRKLEQRGKTDIIDRIDKIVEDLIHLSVSKKYHNHTLHSAKGMKDVHIEGDLILLYMYKDNALILQLKLLDITNHRHLDRDIEYHKKVNATYLYDIEKSLEPPEDNGWNELDDYEAVVELVLDAIIFVDDDGNWDYEDEEYPWAKGDSKNGDWYDEENNVYLGSKEDMVEKTDWLLLKYIPARVGTYHISGYVKLVFEISGVEEKVTDAWYDENHGYDYDSETNTDFADVDYIESKSEIRNFNMHPVDE